MLRGDSRAVRAAKDDVLEMFPILRDRWGQLAGDLSGGEQQQLSLAMAFVVKPKLMCIDELSLGLAPTIVGQLVDKVHEMHERGTSIVVVEQSINVALLLCDRALFLEKGQVRFRGHTDGLLNQPDILRAVFIGSNRPAPAAGVEPAAELPIHERSTRGVTLECHQLTKRFGGIRAVDRVDLVVPPSTIVGLLGHNGAGKTTLFDLLTGYLKADGGHVLLNGEDITDLPPYKRAIAELGRSFQEARLFPSLSVADAVRVSLETHLASREPVAAALRLPASTYSERSAAKRVDELIELLGLGRYRDTPTGDLSTGTRRIVELACLLGQDPAVLLLDEPSAGIAQRETEALAPLLRDVQNETGCSIVVIEHDMALLSALCDYFVALEQGGVIASGRPDEVLSDPRVISSYLGTNEDVVARSGARRDARRASVEQFAVPGGAGGQGFGADPGDQWTETRISGWDAPGTPPGGYERLAQSDPRGTPPAGPAWGDPRTSPPAGYDLSGWNPTSPPAGYDRTGWDGASSPPAGYDRSGWDGASSPPAGYDRSGGDGASSPPAGYDRSGWDPASSPPAGYDRAAWDGASSPPARYDGSGWDPASPPPPAGHDRGGWDPASSPPAGYDRSGWDPASSPPAGYDQRNWSDPAGAPGASARIPAGTRLRPRPRATTVRAGTRRRRHPPATSARAGPSPLRPTRATAARPPTPGRRTPPGTTRARRLRRPRTTSGPSPTVATPGTSPAVARATPAPPTAAAAGTGNRPSPPPSSPRPGRLRNKAEHQGRCRAGVGPRRSSSPRGQPSLGSPGPSSGRSPGGSTGAGGSDGPAGSVPEGPPSPRASPAPLASAPAPAWPSGDDPSGDDPSGDAGSARRAAAESASASSSSSRWAMADTSVSPLRASSRIDSTVIPTVSTSSGARWSPIQSTMLSSGPSATVPNLRMR